MAERGGQGYGPKKFISDQYDKFAPKWWTEWEKLMDGDFEAKKFAMSEFNKIQVKMVPQDLGLSEDVVKLLLS